MVNPQLLQYVRAQRAAGISKEDIVKALAGGGWSAQDAQEAFAAIDAPPPPPTPKPAPPPITPPVSTPPVTAAPMQPRPAPAAAPVSQAPMGMNVRPQPAAVVQPRPAYAPQAKRRSKWPWILLGLIIFFVLGVGAGAYAAVTYDWINSLVSGIAGVEEPQEESMMQVKDEGDTGGFLEVSPDPFDTLPTDEDNSSSTPATGTATSTATTTSGQ